MHQFELHLGYEVGQEIESFRFLYLMELHDQARQAVADAYDVIQDAVFCVLYVALEEGAILYHVHWVDLIGARSYVLDGQLVRRLEKSLLHDRYLNWCQGAVISAHWTGLDLGEILLKRAVIAYAKTQQALALEDVFSIYEIPSVMIATQPHEISATERPEDQRHGHFRVHIFLRKATW